MDTFYNSIIIKNSNIKEINGKYIFIKFKNNNFIYIKNKIIINIYNLLEQICIIELKYNENILMNGQFNKENYINQSDIILKPNNILGYNDITVKLDDINIKSLKININDYNDITNIISNKQFIEGNKLNILKYQNKQLSELCRYNNLKTKKVFERIKKKKYCQMENFILYHNIYYECMLKQYGKIKLN